MLRNAAGLVAFLCMLASPAYAARCAVSERSILGAWQHVSGAGLFQEMEFRQIRGRRLFNSWLHQRPELVDMPWTFARCRIHIRHSDPRLSVTLTVQRVSGNRLHVRTRGQQRDAVYRRIEQ